MDIITKNSKLKAHESLMQREHPALRLDDLFESDISHYLNEDVSIFFWLFYSEISTANQYFSSSLIFDIFSHLNINRFLQCLVSFFVFLSKMFKLEFLAQSNIAAANFKL